MITSEIGLHSFLTYMYIQLNPSSSLCTRKERHNHVIFNDKKVLTEISFFFFFFFFLMFPNKSKFDLKIIFLQNVSPQNYNFSKIDLCGIHLNDHAVFCSNHAHALFHILTALLRLFWCKVEP